MFFMNNSENVKNTDPEMDKAVNLIARNFVKYMRENLGDDALKELFQGIVEMGNKEE